MVKYIIHKYNPRIYRGFLYLTLLLNGLTCIMFLIIIGDLLIEFRLYQIEFEVLKLERDYGLRICQRLE